MPYYIYTNKATGKSIRRFMTISEMLEKAPDGLSEDGVYYHRDITAEHSRQSGGCASWPMKSDAAGVHPSQVEDFSEKTAKMGVPTDFDKTTGQAIFTSRKHRAQYLKAMGIHDRNGGYGDG